jgi:hypothetical protein
MHIRRYPSTAVFVLLAAGHQASAQNRQAPVAAATAYADWLTASLRYPHLFDERQRSVIQEASRGLRDSATRSADDSVPPAPLLLEMLRRHSELVSIELKANSANTVNAGPHALPGDAGALLVHIDNGAADPHFIVTGYDLSARRDAIMIDVAHGETWALIELQSVPAGLSTLVLELRPAGRRLISTMAQVKAPQPARLRLRVLSGDTNKELPAMIEMIWGPTGENRRPSNAIDWSPQFDNLGTPLGPRRAHLPGRLGGRRWWCIPNAIDMPIPPGSWNITVRRGLEYLPVTVSFEARPGEQIEKICRLTHWADMPRAGWWSGDDHVHCQLQDDEDARRLMLWAKAEDVHLVNVLKVGDVYRTWFQQRGFGPAFHVRDGDYILAPGQECPRTHSDGLGHTISLNTRSYIRNVAEYWLYDRVADLVHEQNGLFGFAHTYLLHPYIRRGMSLIAQTSADGRSRVDFAEIMQAGQMGTDFYYDWLNLGYRLAATAGSDVPFQGTIGEVRMYAYLGETPFSSEAWFAAVQHGRTFVTNGPMLELRVDDARPGDEITLKEPRRLRVRARAWGDPKMSLPARLEVVRHGDVIRSIESSQPDQRELTLDFELPVEESLWLAARAAGQDGSLAHTSPVYLIRPPLRFWKHHAVPDLIRQRLENLKDVEQLVARARDLAEKDQAGGNLTAQTMADQSDAILKRVADARAFFEDLRSAAAKERPLRLAASRATP